MDEFYSQEAKHKRYKLYDLFFVFYFSIHMLYDLI